MFVWLFVLCVGFVCVLFLSSWCSCFVGVCSVCVLCLCWCRFFWFVLFCSFV